MCGTVPGHVHMLSHSIVFIKHLLIIIEGRQFQGILEVYWTLCCLRVTKIVASDSSSESQLASTMNHTVNSIIGAMNLERNMVLFMFFFCYLLVCKRTPNGGEEEGGKPLFCLCSSSNVPSHPFFSIATLFYTCTYFSRAFGTSFNFAFMVATPLKWSFFFTQ